MRDAYYHSPAWYKRCDGVKARCKRRCEYCGRRKVVNVHHRTYAHFGHEPLRDLMGVCRACHRWIHDIPYSVGRLKVNEGSLGYAGDSGMGSTDLWRAYLRRCKAKVAA